MRMTDFQFGAIMVMLTLILRHVNKEESTNWSVAMLWFWVLYTLMSSQLWQAFVSGLFGGKP
jgi:hypothetical protein